MPMYSLFLPGQTAGANTVHFDLFNASGSASNLKIHSVNPTVDGSAAVTGLLGVNLFLTRTTAIGTSGTAAVQNSTALTVTPSITGIDTTAPLDNNITARLTPTGGATAGGVLDYACVFTEETSGPAYNANLNMARPPGVPDIPPVIVAEGTGIRVVQGSVASVGVVAYNVVFEVIKK